VEVVHNAFQLAPAVAMGGSNDGEALAVSPLALEGCAPGDLPLRYEAGPETL
jgi:hypothetical protein